MSAITNWHAASDGTWHTRSVRSYYWQTYHVTELVEQGTHLDGGYRNYLAYLYRYCGAVAAAAAAAAAAAGAATASVCAGRMPLISPLIFPLPTRRSARKRSRQKSHRECVSSTVLFVVGVTTFLFCARNVGDSRQLWDVVLNCGTHNSTRYADGTVPRLIWV
jgi:hypothetical protein